VTSCLLKVLELVSSWRCKPYSEQRGTPLQATKWYQRQQTTPPTLWSRANTTRTLVLFASLGASIACSSTWEPWCGVRCCLQLRFAFVNRVGLRRASMAPSPAIVHLTCRYYNWKLLATRSHLPDHWQTARSRQESPVSAGDSRLLAALPHLGEAPSQLRGWSRAREWRCRESRRQFTSRSTFEIKFRRRRACLGCPFAEHRSCWKSSVDWSRRLSKGKLLRTCLAWRVSWSHSSPSPIASKALEPPSWLNGTTWWSWRSQDTGVSWGRHWIHMLSQSQHVSLVSFLSPTLAHSQERSATLESSRSRSTKRRSGRVTRTARWLSAWNWLWVRCRKWSLAWLCPCQTKTIAPTSGHPIVWWSSFRRCLITSHSCLSSFEACPPRNTRPSNSFFLCFGTRILLLALPWRPVSQDATKFLSSKCKKS